MNAEQKAFFMDMENMFNSAGWGRLQQGWESELNSLPEAVFYNAKTVEDLQAGRVRAALLRELLDLPAAVERQKEEIQAGHDPDNG